MSKRFDMAVSVLCKQIREPLYRIPPGIKEKICEVRIRVNQPICLHTHRELLFLRRDGSITEHQTTQVLQSSVQDLQESFRSLCGYSVYAYQHEIRNGFVTCHGGHRVGICGTAVTEKGVIECIRDISSINIRIAKESPGIADPILRSLGTEIEKGLLIIGEPGSGKTTILRDLCRQISSGALGEKKKTSLIDERGEIAGVVQGVPQCDVGLCCDVMDGYPKGIGILQALRCFSPQFILCDELGSAEDAEAVTQGLRAGAAMITTIHAGSIEDLQKRPQGQLLLKTGAFRYGAVLSRNTFGRVSAIYDLHELFS